MTRTPKPQPEVRELKRCPFCGCVTQRRTRPYEVDAPPLHPGVPIAVVNEGTCHPCYKRNRKWNRGPKRNLSPEELAAYQRSLDTYLSGRRARGVPEDGAPVETLEHGGKFLWEVG
jgi:hypothetical protein